MRRCFHQRRRHRSRNIRPPAATIRSCASSLKWLAPLWLLPKMTNQKKTDYICISKESERPAPDTLDETLPCKKQRNIVGRPLCSANRKGIKNQCDALLKCITLIRIVAIGCQTAKRGTPAGMATLWIMMRSYMHRELFICAVFGLENNRWLQYLDCVPCPLGNLATVVALQWG